MVLYTLNPPASFENLGTFPLFLQHHHCIRICFVG